MHKPELKQHIVLVDDDPGLCDLISVYLSDSGYQIDVANDGEAMRKIINRQAVDLVLLDLMLPGEDGLSLLRWILERHGPPVIIISARGDEVDRVVGLELGADDYLAKPFGPRELLARVRAVLRRTSNDSEHGNDGHTLSFGHCRLQLNEHCLMGETGEITLTSGEFNLLRVFLEHPNRVLSRDQLISLLKGYERSPFDRSIDVQVTRLRRKIEPRPEAPIYLRTVWGAGYLFAPQGETHT